MDQSAPPQPTFELPAQGQMPDQAPGQPVMPEAPAPASPERLMTPGNVPGGAPMQPIATPVQQGPPAGAPPVPVPIPAPQQGATAHMSAADADLIEKEWVSKAKAIVESTRQDPYVQNREINKVKADYLKKRYNKDLPVADK